MNEQPQRDPRALNAYRHGITGQILIQTPAEREAYELHCRQYHQDLAPVGVLEVQLAQTIADDQWRLNRAKAIEAAIYGMGIHNSKIPDDTDPNAFGLVAMANTWLKDDKKIALMNLYAHRIQSAITKNTAVLRQLQQDRHAALKKAAEEMAALAQLAESKGEAFDPARDFPPESLPPQFVFSTPQIARIAAHHRLLTEAKTRPQTHKKAA